MPYRLALLLLWLGLAPAAFAETRYVSDQFEVTLRRGMSTQHSIIRMLPSGTALEVLDTDPDTGYSQVRTASGTEGYVLTRYLMREPSAREQLAALRARLDRASNEQGGLSRQIDELAQQLATAEQTIAELTTSKAALEGELERIKQISQNALRLEETNRNLKQRLASSESDVRQLTGDNEALRRNASRDWFLAGGGLVVFSLLLGIGLTRVRWRRRSRWSDF